MSRRGLVRLAGCLAVIAGLGGALGLGCHRSRPADGPPVARAFYFWRTTFALSDAETRALAEAGITRLYVRVFDVTWNEADRRAVPVGPLVVPNPPPGASGSAAPPGASGSAAPPGTSGSAAPLGASGSAAPPGATGSAAPPGATGSPVPPGIDVVPVVFVRDQVLRHAAVAPLARDLWAEVQRKAAALGVTPHELQIDCDWTDHTRDAYFALLRALRQTSGVALSATIRLHQIKYRERTGVPPVDRGMLMFYNMGKFSADPDARAIFDAAAAERYLARLADYPLPLDLALPIWSWTVQVRDGIVVGLLQHTDPATLDAAAFLTRGDDGRYLATRTTFLDGALIREGDELKTEVTGPDETAAAAALVDPHLPALSPQAQPRTVTLFDLSERNLRRHDARSLDRVFRAVH